MSERKDELIIFMNAKLIEMEENQQMINEQELDRKKKKRREKTRIFVVN